ncbi:hypothetical protein EDB19DRAFT_1915147 [Suillus lakei]|nr:hypothetical protein EDB19DRAFT_1915147 [Suillus lakei]
MSPSTPLGSGTGNAPNMYLHPRHYPPPQPPQHPQPFMQHYPPIPHHYAPPLHHYAPPHFVQYPQYPPMRPNIETTPASSIMRPDLEAPAVPASLRAPAAPASSQASRLRPNPEPHPGARLCGETDMPWEDFKSRVLAFLDSAADEVQLVYKFVGDNSRATQLNDVEAFSIAMDRLCHKAFNARTRVVALELPQGQTDYYHQSKKEDTRADDIPPASSDDDVTQLKAYKQLESQIRCELHHGHCFVDARVAMITIVDLITEMTLWAKKIALGHATIYNPPHCLNFDRGPTKKPRHSRSASSPEVHVTIQNITADPTAVEDSQPSPLSQPHRLNLQARSLAPFPDYPKVGVLLGLIDAERPELRLAELETPLLDAGVFLSSQVILLPEDVLSVIGDMGQRRARILRNYAKRTVLPLLGLVNSYEEPEISEIPSAGSQNKGKERAVEAEDDMWQEENHGLMGTEVAGPTSTRAMTKPRGTRNSRPDTN